LTASGAWFERAVEKHGRGFPGVPALLRLAEALGVMAERLAEGVDDPADEESGPCEGESRGKRQGKAP
jgi:hypothetical protein